MRRIFSGFDSAWTISNEGAIAHLVIDDETIEFGEPETVSFDGALKSLNRVGTGADLHVIAVDQPLIVPNESGSRPVEGVFRPLLGRIGGAIQPSSTSRIDMFGADAPIWPFLRELDADFDPMAIPNAEFGHYGFECRPVAAQIAFASTESVIQRLYKYNPGRGKTYTWSDWQALNLLMATAASGMDLPSVAAWFTASADLTPRKADQDKVDAAICVLIAWLWWRDGMAGSAMIGDTETGYIVTPVSPPMTAVLSPTAKALGVPLRTDVVSSPIWEIARKPSAAKLRVRQAELDDCEAIASIYNQGIVDRVATLETEERTASERTEWLLEKGGRHPVLVAIDADGTVAGWASLNQFSSRPAYNHVADISVYVDRAQRGRGIGEQLLVALEAKAREHGFHKLVLAAFPTNKPGLKLYQRRGFKTVGIYHEQGKLDDRWVDTIIMEKLLN